MIESERIATDDLVTYNQRLKEELAPDVPIFLIGHSLGGSLSLLTANATPETI